VTVSYQVTGLSREVQFAGAILDTLYQAVDDDII